MPLYETVRQQSGVPDREYGSIPVWHQNTMVPEHLSLQGREQVSRTDKKMEDLCISICQHFSRFKEILPDQRLYSRERQALIGLKFLDMEETGLNRILLNAERMLRALKACNDSKPCQAIACPTCSVKRRSVAIYEATKYLHGVMRRNHCQRRETVVLSVTIANRREWCRELKFAHEVLSGRRNSLRRAVGMLADSNLGDIGQTTDVLASIDVKYQSPVDRNAENSKANMAERLDAECDVHLHALLCFVPFGQERIDVSKVDWADQAKFVLERKFGQAFDIHVQHLDHQVTREMLCKAGLRSRMLTKWTQSVIYTLAYQTKTATLDQVSSKERPLVRAAIGPALGRANGIAAGAPIIIRSYPYDSMTNYAFREEQDLYIRLGSDKYS